MNNQIKKIMWTNTYSISLLESQKWISKVCREPPTLLILMHKCKKKTS
jgi:hypothetical protein